MDLEERLIQQARPCLHLELNGCGGLDAKLGPMRGLNESISIGFELGHVQFNGACVYRIIVIVIGLYQDIDLLLLQYP